jgi:long-chain acyl-CoA synthetase
MEERPSFEPCVYLHSGGTTGTPKAIALSDDALNNLSDKMVDVLGEEAKDIHNHGMMAVLPTFHGFGLGIGVHTPLKLGFRCVLFMKFEPKKILRAIDRGDVTLLIGIPLLYQKLMNHPMFAKTDFSHLEACYVGGDNVPTSLLASFNEMMEKRGSHCLMQEGYGLTETVTVCNVNTRAQYRLGSVGKPLTGMVNEIRDENGNLLGHNAVGEVYVGGNTLMNGYLHDQEATAQTVVEVEGRRMIRTGDLGYVDSDGFLFLKGRKKRVFKISGMNVYPAEIEKLVTDNNDVRDASLEFFEEPKPHTVLFVIREQNCQKTEKELAANLMALISQHQLKYALPQRVIFLSSFPQTAVGKIDHSAFRE